METRKNRLYLGGIPASRLVKQFGSPLYVYEEETIRNRFREIRDHLTYPYFRIYYACKANSNLAVLKVLKEEGACIDASSPGEVILSMKAGYPPEKILFTSEGVSNEEMEFLIKKGILVNLTSISQMERFGELVQSIKKKSRWRISVRINPELGAGHHKHVITGGKESHFGIYRDEIQELKRISRKWGLQVIGVHSHIGSGILKESQFLQVMRILSGIAMEFPSLEFVNFGGGIGVPYRKEESPLNMENLGRRISLQLKKISSRYGKDLLFAMEPGRFLVAEAGFLLARVNVIKRTPRYHFVVVDSGFNHLIRPMAYGAYHEILNVNRVKGRGRKVVVAGNLCESGDIFTRNERGIEERWLPRILEGDVLAFLNAGAYGFSMSSNYDGRLRPMEVMVNEGNARVIRKREKYDDLLRGMV